MKSILDLYQKLPDGVSCAGFITRVDKRGEDVDITIRLMGDVDIAEMASMLGCRCDIEDGCLNVRHTS